ncbi:signal transduction histidine kinase [Bacillus mesophilus]|uniref:histidine kinase n=1 Tax=Bacillus mesophilus TaxID=1808955 RepID=A0A6M0Q910_9BACI|nr:ATP-binding protein [Bacillus mesophilus]MBM7661570.1 signal transduction histidine kinase [Bacillus mesophilus]NEY72239.1 GHKL domain-containing protein [Bacillus mesophilus]
MKTVEHNITYIPFPLFVIDLDFNVLQVSEETYSQFPSVTNFLELVDTDSRKKLERFMRPEFAKAKIELNLMTKQNTLALYDVYTQWENDERLYLYCIEKQESLQQIQEIIVRQQTQLENENLILLEKQEQLEVTLKKMEKVVMQHDNLANFGKIASSIASELKRPLISIGGFIQLIKPHLVDTGKAHYANIALDEINHANNLIYQFLSTHVPALPEKKQANVQKIISDVIASTRNEAGRNGCSVKYVKEQILPVIDIDPLQIKQVLLNLIKNGMDAIQASSNKQIGNIEIRTKLQKDTVEISVHDNGKGMDHETQRRIFTPFYTTKDKGIGIGLSVCLKIIQNHGGIIETKSNVGEGSMFTIVLPIES